MHIKWQQVCCKGATEPWNLVPVIQTIEWVHCVSNNQMRLSDTSVNRLRLGRCDALIERHMNYIIQKSTKWVPSVLSECWIFEPSSATGFFFFVYIRFGPFFKYLGCLGTVDKPLS